MAGTTAALLRGEKPDATAAACTQWQAETKGGELISARDFARLLDAACNSTHFTARPNLAIDPEAPIQRTNACRLIFSAPQSPD